MICPRCNATLYEGMKKCIRCGYSESEVEKILEKQIDAVTISKFPIINKYYRKIFGDTDKLIVKRILKYCVLLFFLIWLFFHFFIYFNISDGCFVTIRPALIELSNISVKKGIKYLKKEFPMQYRDFCENVTSISPNIACGGFGGGCFYNNEPKTIYISTTYGNYTNAAKVIIHETCHVIQHKENRPINEEECYTKDSVIPWNLIKD